MSKRKSKLTMQQKKQLFKTAANFTRIKRENARSRKAIELNNELNSNNNPDDLYKVNYLCK